MPLIVTDTLALFHQLATWQSLDGPCDDEATMKNIAIERIH